MDFSCSAVKLFQFSFRMVGLCLLRVITDVVKYMGPITCQASPGIDVPLSLCFPTFAARTGFLKHTK